MNRFLIALALLAGASSAAQARLDGPGNGGPVFNGISLNGVNFNGLQFNDVRFNGVQFNGFQLNGLGFNGILLNGYRWNGISLQGPNMTASVAPAADWSAVPLASVQVRLPEAR